MNNFNVFLFSLFFVFSISANFARAADNVLLSKDAKMMGVRGNVEDAREMNKAQQKVKQDLSTSSYATAFVLRANIAKEKESKEKKFANKSMREIKDNEMQPTLKSINLRLNSIVTMQSILAQLEGVMALNRAETSSINEE